MRRSFQLATVFTGVAGIAGGFGPTAFAPAAQAAAIRPDILAWQSCGPNDGGISHWVHLYYPNDDHPAECFHGAGYHSATAVFASFCPGTNSGLVKGSAAGYPHQNFPFSHGEGRKPVAKYDGGWFGDYNISYMSIYGWSGDATCL